MKELTTRLLDTVIYDSNLLISQMRSICIETVRLPQILGNGGFFFFFKDSAWDFPSGPVVKILCFQWRCCGFNPLLGN